MGYNVFGSIEQSLMALWVDIVRFVPELLTALLVLVVGWIIGGILGRVVSKAFTFFHLDTALDKAGVDTLSERAGYKFKPAHFAGAIVKWFIIIAFAVVAFDILNLGAVTTFMRDDVLGYLPNVFAAVLILFAAVLIANVASKAMMGILRSTGTGKVELYGKVAYYAVVFFGVLAALNQLQIAAELVQTLFMGIVFALSLGLGLAFGLGGKDTAARYLNKLSKDS
jgi:hypothetical protein